jgi:hypothetical protein
MAKQHSVFRVKTSAFSSLFVPRRIRGTTVILIECKAADYIGGLEAAADEALAQIDRRKYEEGWRAEGYRNFIHYGFAFYKKDVLVKTV